MTWKGLPKGTRDWIALLSFGGMLAAAFVSYGAVTATRGLPEKVDRNTVVSDSALILAKENRLLVIASDSARAADSERIRRIDRTLCRQVASDERERRECDKL